MDIFNPVYRQDYFEGYSSGLDPHLKYDLNECSEAFISGFYFGRLDYETKNGAVDYGIPQLIVTKKILEDFLLAGILGMDIDAEGYTPFQFDLIAKWYKNGVDQYNPDQSIYLSEILEQNGIELMSDCV